jgi:hypothetical protein
MTKHNIHSIKYSLDSTTKILHLNKLYNKPITNPMISTNTQFKFTKKKRRNNYQFSSYFLNFVFYLLNFNHLDFNQPQEFLNCLIKD